MSTKEEGEVAPPKKKGRSRLGDLYEIDDQKVTAKLKNRKCPRCGSIMAFHKAPVERWTCGSCSFTDFIKPK